MRRSHPDWGHPPLGGPEGDVDLQKRPAGPPEPHPHLPRTPALTAARSARHDRAVRGAGTAPSPPPKGPAMFGRKRPTATTTPTTQPSDQYRLKRTGQQVTLLEHLRGGEVRIAMDTDDMLRDDIV